MTTVSHLNVRSRHAPRKRNAQLEAGSKRSTNRQYSADLSACAQRRRFLDALRCASVSTLEVRPSLEILHPAMRVRELRLEGYDILTIRVSADTCFGVKYSVACYVLFAEPERGDHGQ